MATTGHGLTWDQVRERPADELQVGDQWVTTLPGTARWVSPDGTVRGHSIGLTPVPLNGVLWTLTARDGNQITGRRRDTGDTVTGQIREGSVVLLVQK